ncbi:endoplasmic reticulum Golgi intermediate [Echinococcus multilocularis]|uniref:Endoplasmic reticulum-Golgi intermediate compartment protein 3 n=1 Tax=Echinococcus multilocularis TaxID=6211 RepID=A0A068YL03_ECHMU|nr:endoplasmic reticulum Golgi intermediate [Echinococcus multilocularis]
MPPGLLPRSLRQFDAFAKPLKDFRIQTVSGAFLSIISLFIILVLFTWEVADYISPSVKQEIIVDISRNRHMSISFDIIFPLVPCYMLSVDSMDISGEQHSSITKEVNKTRVLKDGSGVDFDSNSEKMKALEQKRDRNYCGSCYGAGAEDNQCCNTCESVLEAYRVRGWTIPDPDVFEQCKDEKEAGSLAAINQEGCRLVGQLGVNKVAGSFHIAPGKSYGQGHVHVHDLMAFSGKRFVLDHKIRRLSFGDTYPGQINPLDNTNMSDSTESPMISYFLKLVPTIYSDFSEKPLVTNQYSVTWQVKSTSLTGGSDGIPGVFFNYQISPLLVKLTKERRSFLHFLTNTCAIVGGVYTVASLLDAFVYRSSCFLAKLNGSLRESASSSS